jgi:hypothetical protein
MWRFLGGVASTLLLVGAGLFLWKGIAQSDDPIPPPGQPLLLQKPALTTPPSADRSREEKRFDRYDKDRDQLITETEYLASRHKAFDKLDGNHDGRLSFEEWAVRTTEKFAKADVDRSGMLSREEFGTTKAKRVSRPRCDCASGSD